MQCKDNKNFDADLLLRIFVDVDDFYKVFKAWYDTERTSELTLSEMRQNVRQPSMSASEIVTLLIYYHHSGYKNFEYYYEGLVLTSLRSEFPTLLSYSRFVELIPRVSFIMFMYAQYTVHQKPMTGISIIDSKKLPVCAFSRMAQHKVFEGIAAKGKSSTGWFFGQKIHLIINHLGDIIRFKITPANVSDNNHDLLKELLKTIKGKVIGDKGYISTLFATFYEQGIHIITKIRSNMKNKLMKMEDKLLLKKRPVIEAVNDILMTVCDIDHTRHRSPINAHTHICAGIIAYSHLEDKPNILIKKLIGA